MVLCKKWRNAYLFFQTRTRATRERASVAAICPWTVRTAASTSARMMAAARTVVIRVLRIPTMAHHRTIPRRCRRVYMRPSTIPSTNCSWCKVVTSAATTRNPNFPLSSSLYLLPSVTVSFWNSSFISHRLHPLLRPFTRSTKRLTLSTRKPT